MPGDGIGPDVIGEALRVLKTLEDADQLLEQQDIIAGCALPVQEVIVHLYFHHLYEVLEASGPLPN